MALGVALAYTTVMPGQNYAVVLTHNRPVELAACIAAIDPQVDLVIVVDNASDPPASPPILTKPHLVIVVPEQPPNLSTLWNLALADAAEHADGERHNVALLCDDVVVPEGWFATVRRGMRNHGAGAASTHQATPITSPIVKTAPDRDVWNRMCGWAFMLAGERGLRADERLRWWWCDTHLDFLARRNGGMVLAPGPVAVNSKPNGWTTQRVELAEQAGKDGETFAEIWAHDGGRPW